MRWLSELGEVFAIFGRFLGYLLDVIQGEATISSYMWFRENGYAESPLPMILTVLTLYLVVLLPILFLQRFLAVRLSTHLLLSIKPTVKMEQIHLQGLRMLGQFKHLSTKGKVLNILLFFNSFLMFAVFLVVLNLIL